MHRVRKFDNDGYEIDDEGRRLIDRGSRAVEAEPAGPRSVVVQSLESRYALDRYRDELVGRDGAAPRRVLANIRDQAQEKMRNPYWAKLYCEIMGWTGTREQLLAALVRELGVPLERAREAVATVIDVPEDIHEIAAMTREWLAWYDGPDGPGYGRAHTKAGR